MFSDIILVVIIVLSLAVGQWVFRQVVWTFVVKKMFIETHKKQGQSILYLKKRLGTNRVIGAIQSSVSPVIDLRFPDGYVEIFDDGGAKIVVDSFSRTLTSTEVRQSRLFPIEVDSGRFRHVISIGLSEMDVKVMQAEHVISRINHLDPLGSLPRTIGFIPNT